MLLSASFMLSFLSKISFWGVGEEGLHLICLAHFQRSLAAEPTKPLILQTPCLWGAQHWGGLFSYLVGGTFAGPSARALVVPHLLFLAVKSATSRSCLPATLKGMVFVRLRGINVLYLWR